VLADGAGSPIDQGVSMWLLVGAVFLGWIAFARLRNRAFVRVPRWIGWASGVAASVAVVLALVLPPIIRPDATSNRPRSTATISFLSPRPGQVFRGDPAGVSVRMRVRGGRIVPFTSTRLTSDTGHVHLYLDGALVAMTTSLHRTVSILPGEHTLLAEFVAVDHAPFDPRVLVRVRFRVVA
jgi:hypothetical protein